MDPAGLAGSPPEKAAIADILARVRQGRPECAAEGVEFPRSVLRLSELKLLDRERRVTERHIRQAIFDVVKSLDSFDFLVVSRNLKVLKTMRMAVFAEMMRDTVDGWAFSIRSGSC